MFTISIGKADVVCPDKITLTSGMVKAVKVAFVFSEEWDDFTKIVVFSNGVTDIDVSLDDYNMCYIPHEILADVGREVTCGVYGYKGDGKERVAIPTVKCSLGKVVEGVNPSGDEPTEATQTLWEEIMVKVEEHDDFIGNPYYTQAVNLKGITTATPGHEDAMVEITDNSVSSDWCTFDIDIHGDVRFTCECTESRVLIVIDGMVMAEIGVDTDGGETKYTFEGVIKNGMTVHCSMAMAKFTEFEARQYVADTIGDIDTALDAILAIQSEVVGDEA
jgi:hypothetical protein